MGGWYPIRPCLTGPDPGAQGYGPTSHYKKPAGPSDFLSVFWVIITGSRAECWGNLSDAAQWESMVGFFNDFRDAGAAPARVLLISGD